MRHDMTLRNAQDVLRHILPSDTLIGKEIADFDSLDDGLDSQDVPQTRGGADDVVIALVISPFTVATSLIVL